MHCSNTFVQTLSVGAGKNSKTTDSNSGFYPVLERIVGLSICVLALCLPILSSAQPGTPFRVGMTIKDATSPLAFGQKCHYQGIPIDLSSGNGRVQIRIYSDMSCTDAFKGVDGDFLAIFEDEKLKLSFPRPTERGPAFRLTFGNHGVIQGQKIETFYLMEWSGGAHCCFTYHLFQTAPKIKHVQSVEMGDSEGKVFTCGQTKCLSYHTIFSYWRGSFAESIGIKTVLQLTDGRFTYSRELTEKYKDAPHHPLKIAQLKRALQNARLADERYHRVHNHTYTIGSIQGSEWNQPLLAVAEHVATLIFQGKNKEAETLLTKVWPEEMAPEYLANFRKDLLEQIRSSSVWSDLLKANGGVILGAIR